MAKKFNENGTNEGTKDIREKKKKQDPPKHNHFSVGAICKLEQTVLKQNLRRSKVTSGSGSSSSKSL